MKEKAQWESTDLSFTLSAANTHTYTHTYWRTGVRRSAVECTWVALGLKAAADVIQTKPFHLHWFSNNGCILFVMNITKMRLSTPECRPSKAPSLIVTLLCKEQKDRRRCANKIFRGLLLNRTNKIWTCPDVVLIPACRQTEWGGDSSTHTKGPGEEEEAAADDSDQRREEGVSRAQPQQRHHPLRCQNRQGRAAV